MFRGRDALIAALDEVKISADGDAIVEAHRLIDRLQAEVAEAEVEFVRSKDYELEGHASCASLLRARCGATVNESNRIAMRAKKLGRWPEVLDAWLHGRIRGHQVDVMTAIVPVHHVERFAEDAAEYLVALEHLTTEDTRSILINWKAAADDAAQTEAAEGGCDPVEEVPSRSLSASRIIDDRLEVSGSFDKDSGHRIETALVAAMRPDDEDEHRSPLQRRADALVEICRFYIAHHQDPPGNGRPDRAVIVADVTALFRAILRGDGVHTAAQLQHYLAARTELGALERGLFLDACDGHGGTARSLDGHSVTDLLLRHVATNGILERLLRVGSRIIDHGRSTRIFTESQKRAMAVRDGGSRISGRPPWSCHAHHSPEFDHGGTTDVNAGYLKTAHEHLDQHRKGFTDRINPDGTITLSGPDGRQRDLQPPNWPGDGPSHPVHTTAGSAPVLPFRPATDAGLAVEPIDWNALEPRTEVVMEEGWEPHQLDDDEDDPAEITRIDAYIRRRNRRAIRRERGAKTS